MHLMNACVTFDARVNTSNFNPATSVVVLKLLFWRCALKRATVMVEICRKEVKEENVFEY